eukprot:1924415-Rhodomonas_salina.1
MLQVRTGQYQRRPRRYGLGHMAENIWPRAYGPRHTVQCNVKKRERGREGERERGREGDLV